MTVSIASSIVALGGQGDHRDARDHDLVDALVAELDDRVDHLLLLGLEDALLAAALDDQAELLGADPPCRLRRPRRTARATALVTAVRTATSGPRTRSRNSIEAAQAQREALGVGERQALRHELAEDDREQRQQQGHDDQREASPDDAEDRDPVPVEGLGRLVGQADRRVGRREEAR